MRILIIILVFLSIPVMATPAFAEKRVALVIGNAAYQHQLKLRTPVNDVGEVVRVLKKSGFLVIEGRDLTKRKMDEIIYRKFLPLLEQADVSLFYYSGHALQVKDVNHLIPIDAKMRAAYDLDIETINFSRIMELIKLKSGTRLFFLDACRDNPFSGRQFSAGNLSRSVATRGMAPVIASVGTLVTYSTAPGKVAFDGEGELSPFTSAFTRHALTPKIDIRQMMTRVRRNVIVQTKSLQIPWERSALIKDFHFIEPRPAPVVKAVHQASLGRSDTGTKLNVPTPYQTAGGGLRITFRQLPQKGNLLVGDDIVRANISMTPEQFRLLSFKARNLATGAVQIAGYTVEDDWGNREKGLIVLNQTGQDAVPAPLDANAEQAGPQLARLAEKFRALVASPIETTIGVGAVPLGLNPPEHLTDGGQSPRLVVLEPPLKGQLLLAERVLGQNASIEMEQIKDLKYVPAIGQERTPVTTRWRFVKGTAQSDPINVDLQPVLHACDQYGSQPFDLQSVSQGVYSHHMQGKKAQPACLKAMALYPGIPRFIYQLGRAELALGHSEKARQLYQISATKGHVRAFHGLGFLYAFGGGGKIDHAKANQYFTIGAAKGDVYSMHSLGMRLYRGLGNPKNHSQGLTLLLQAANMGHVFAMNELTRIFRKGDGVAKNTSRSLRYAVESSIRKDTYGYNNMGFHYLDGDGLPTDYKKALTWFLKAHKGGHPEAGNTIGRMYAKGWGVSKNVDIASGWYELSAKRGSAWAANNRARIALKGPKRLQDPLKATYFYALSAGFKREKPSKIAKRVLRRLPARYKYQTVNKLLNDLNYEVSPIRGNRFSNKTRLAVNHFARQHKLSRTDDLNALLTQLALQKWIKENPRIDLF